jgi:hypothetical protein
VPVFSERIRDVMFRFGAALFVLAAVTAAQETTHREGWVVLPVDEYKVLRARAYPPDREPQPPPVAATLTRVDYDLKVVGDSASGEARLTVDVLQDGWVRMPIPVGLLVREARVDGRPVSLVEGSGKSGATAPYVLFARSGRSVLALDLAVPVSAAAGVETLTLPASDSALSRAVLLIPGEHLDVSLGGGLLAEKAETGGGTRCVAHGRSGEPLHFSWQPRLVAKKAALPLRLRGRVTELAGLGEDGVQLSAEVEIEVVQGAAPAVTLQLPDGLVVNQVSGGLVGDWEVRGRALAVSFLEPVEKTAAFVIVAEARVPRDGLVTVPLMRLVDAEREMGGVAVEVLGEGEMQDRQMTGMQDADPADLGASVAGRDSPSLVAFRYHVLTGHEPRALAVTVSRYSAQAVVPINAEEARYRVLLGEEGKALVQARWAVRNNQRAFLTVTLPPGAELWSAAAAGRPVRPGRGASGVLLLPLAKSRAGEDAAPFLVEVVYLQRGTPWAEKGEELLSLPSVDVEVSRTGLELQHSPRFRLDTKGGPFRLQPYAEPFSAAFRPSAQAGGGAEAAKAKTATEERARKDLQTLVDSVLNERRGKKVAGTVPLAIPFPAFGSSLFLASELTAQGTAPVVELAYRRDRK